MNESSPASNPALGPTLIAVLVGGTLYAIYSMLLFSGPYRWLAELQLRWFDAYYVSTTCAFTLLLFVVPPVVAIRVLGIAGRIPADSWAMQIATPRASTGLTARLARAKRWLMVFVVGGVFTAMSARNLVVAERGLKLEVLKAEVLEGGAEPKSTWLQVEGMLDWDRALETEERREAITYVPVISDAWEPKRPLGALLAVNERDLERLEDEPFKGAVDISGTPGMVRAAYENIGVDVSRATVIEFGESPLDKAGGSRPLLVFGVLLLAIGGVGSFFRMRA